MTNKNLYLSFHPNENWRLCDDATDEWTGTIRGPGGDDMIDLRGYVVEHGFAAARSHAEAILTEHKRRMTVKYQVAYRDDESGQYIMIVKNPRPSSLPAITNPSVVSVTWRGIQADYYWIIDADRLLHSKDDEHEDLVDFVLNNEMHLLDEIPISEDDVDALADKFPFRGSVESRQYSHVGVWVIITAKWSEGSRGVYEFKLHDIDNEGD